MVSRVLNSLSINGLIPLWLVAHMITSKSPLTYKVSTYYYISHPNLITRLFTAPRLTLDHYRGAASPDVNHCVWYLFDPKVTGSLGLNQNPSSSECSALTHFSMSLAHKYANLKHSYNYDIKEQVTTKTFLKEKTGFTWNPQPLRYSVQKVYFKFNPLSVVLTFQIIYQ